MPIIATTTLDPASAIDLDDLEEFGYRRVAVATDIGDNKMRSFPEVRAFAKYRNARGDIVEYVHGSPVTAEQIRTRTGAQLANALIAVISTAEGVAAGTV